MILYQCDMCGKIVSNGNDLDSITVLCESEEQLPFGDGKKKFDVCAECSLEIGRYIEAHTNKQSGLRCSIANQPFESVMTGGEQ